MLRPVITRKCPTICLLAALWALLSPPAAAAAQPRQADAAADDAFTTYEFDDDKVVGDTAQPSGEVLTVRRRSARDSLIRAREHFIRELLKSVEAL